MKLKTFKDMNSKRQFAVTPTLVSNWWSGRKFPNFLELFQLVIGLVILLIQTEQLLVRIEP